MKVGDLEVLTSGLIIALLMGSIVSFSFATPASAISQRSSTMENAYNQNSVQLGNESKNSSSAPVIEKAGLKSAGPQLDNKLSENIQREIEQKNENETIRIIVRLAPANLEDVPEAAVIGKLKEYASETQKPVIDFLQSQGAKILNNFWIANAILVEAKVSTVRDLASLSSVRGIHEDFQVMVQKVDENEPNRSNIDNSQWGTHDDLQIKTPDVSEGTVAVSQIDGATWGLNRIRAPDTWELGINGSGIRVAVLDTGVDITHPDLVGKMWTDNPADPTYPGGWIEFDSNGYVVLGSTPHDTDGHGTHTSGTVLGDNASGTAIGVAPGAWLMHALILPGGSGSFAQCIAGMEWAIDPVDQYGNPAGQRADIASMSWGAEGYYDQMIEPVRNMKAAGVVPVAAIGNDGEGTSGSPGNVYEAFGVGAIAEDNTVAVFSGGEIVSWSASYSEPYVKPDFSAPGVDVYSSIPGGYASWSGTSMATPHVAGTIALMLEANPLLTVDDVYNTLESTSQDLGSPGKDTRYGWGVVDAFDAVVMVHYDSGIEGYVTDASTSNGIPGAKVEVQGTSWTRYTAENGYYRIFLPPDNYTLMVTTFGYYDNVVVTSVVENQWTNADIVLNPLPGGFITGEITDLSSNPLQNAVVRLSDTPISTRTDNTGSYTIRAPIGSYDAKASMDGYKPALAENVLVLENQTTILNFQLEPFIALLIQDSLPWGIDSNREALEEFGISYDVISSSMLDTWDLSKYNFVMYSSDQPYSYYMDIANNLDKICFYVVGGGLIIAHCFDGGWNGGDWRGLSILPGDITHLMYLDSPDYDSQNIHITDSSHTVVTGDGVFTLTDDYLSNWNFSTGGIFTNLIAGTDVVMVSSDNTGDGPTYVDYNYSRGKVLATMQPPEWGYSRIGKPELLRNELRFALEWSPPPPPPFGVCVSISPPKQGGKLGKTLEYTVTVKNMGIFEDTYDLTVHDYTGWWLTLSENRLENVVPGEKRTVTLSVAIPENASLGTQDNITVTAISTENSGVSDSAMCVGHSARGVILFDQTHGTDWIAYYQIWVETLILRGYAVETHNSGLITPSALEGYDVFVIPQAYYDYDPDELSAIENFVLDGGGLLVIGDDNPWIYTNLTSFAGITWGYGGYSGYTSNITQHRVTEGVDVADFVAPASQLYVTSPAKDLIRDSYGYTKLLAVSEVGIGKVIGIADEDTIMDGNIGYANNLTLANNMIDWLATRYEHDLSVSLVAPALLKPGSSTLLEATVYNRGLENENNVELRLLINYTMVDSVVIPELPVGSSYTLDYLWTPTVIGTYDVTAYAPPVSGEEYTINNAVTKTVKVQPIKGYILFDQTHGTDLIANYSIWVQTLTLRGYVVETNTSDMITPFLLEGYDVLVIPVASWDYTSDELSAIENFVLNGKGLLVVGDYYPEIYTNLTSFAGITWAYGGYSGNTSNITPHPVTDGVTVAYFGSPNSQLYVASPAEDLIRDSYGYTKLLAVSEVGNGKVIGVADQDSINNWAIVYGNNLLLANNMVDWLATRYEHDLGVSLASPRFLKPSDSSLLEATVYNRGLENENNVELQLLIDNTVVDSVTIPELPAGTSYELDYLWTPTVEGTYEVEAYAPPVSGEEYTGNNVSTKTVKVRPIKGYILFDQTHGTDLIANYSIWVENLIERGYVAENLTYGTITPLVLAGYDILVIPQARSDYTTDELSAIENFVLNGKGLLVIGDDYPWVYTNLTSFAGITWTSGGYSGYTSNITPHPVTDGVTVAYFGAPISQLYVSASAEDLIRDNYGYNSVLLAVSEIGIGRVIGIADESTIDDWDIGIANNSTLANNMIDWLATRYEHDLDVSLVAPALLKPDNSTLLEATVYNRGLENENNVELQLLIDNTVVDSVTIPELPAGTSYELDYLWTPTVEGTYEVEAYAPPVPGEEFVGNNQRSKPVEVFNAMFAVVLDSWGTDYSNSASWDYLNSNWASYGDNRIVIDYTSLNKENITLADIEATQADVLIISDAWGYYYGWEFTDSEIDAIKTYVLSGHGIIATSGTFDTYDAPNNQKLAELFGMDQMGWYGWAYYTNGIFDLLAPRHDELWRNIPDPDVVGSQPTLTPTSSTDWTVQGVTRGWTEALSRDHYAAVITNDNTRAVYFTSMPELYGNSVESGRQLLYNAIVWASQRYQHDLAVSLVAPTRLERGDSALLEAIVYNSGLANENNVELQLLIDNTVVDSVTIPELPVGGSYTIDYMWAPTSTGNYTITAYAPSVPEEDYLTNNVITRRAGVFFYTRLYVPHEWFGGGDPMGWHADDGSWAYSLPFDFPFYGVEYRTIYISSNGLITFNSQDASYSNSISALAGKLAIASAWDDWLTYDPYDIYTWENSSNVGIRWYVRSLETGLEANFEVILGEDGLIQLDYGYNEGPISATIGISDGAGHILAEDVTDLNYINTIFFAPFELTYTPIKPVKPNPGTWWPSGTFWGTNLRFENDIYVSQTWFGTRATELRMVAPPDPPDGLTVEFFENSAWFEWVKVAADHENWPVRMRSVGAAPSSGTLSTVLENADTLFVPQDFSVVLENSSTGWKVNLRKENKLITGLPKFATLYVDNAVNVTISPGYQEGIVGDNSTYIVTVNNTGRYDDNYSLDVNAGGWWYDISPSTLSIPAGGSENATLSVILGTGAQNIDVTATGFYAMDEAITSALGTPFSISVLPSENYALPGENVCFTVIVKNFEDNFDNYSLIVSDDAGWGLALDDSRLENVAPGENRTTSLRVTIPDNEDLMGVEDNITVIATSQRNPWASENAFCTAGAGHYGVRVSIIPDYQDNSPGCALNYLVMVSNTGTIDDSYNLTFGDNIDGGTYWENSIYIENSLLVVPAGENRTTTLTVIIPDNTIPGTEDNITVTATSQTDNTVSDSDSCIAHAASLSISISPDYQSGLPGETLNYVIDIKNNENADGDYYSVVTDSLGWEPALGFKRILIAPLDEVWTILKVTVPENAIGCTADNVTVTMISIDNTALYSASCVAHATIVRGVDVSIMPDYQETYPGRTLEYEVIIRNTGDVDDNYNLTATDNDNWNLNIAPSIMVPAFENMVTTLRVTIPENAENCTRDNVIVTATSQENSQISYSASCIAHAVWAEFTLNLVSGWNLVGFSLTRDNMTPNNTFTDLTYYTDYYIYAWIVPNGPYALLDPDTVLEDNIGYWIWINQDNTVRTTGISPDNRDIHLITGWNLVHFPVVDNTTTPNNVFTGLTYYDNYYIYYWNAPNGPYTLQDPDQLFELPTGYWVWIDQNWMVTVLPLSLIVKNPDTLVYDSIGEPETLDPAWAYDTTSAEVIQNVYETLISYKDGKTDEFDPRLADNWTMSADGLTYTFRIRTGVKFQNGDDLTPQDVEYSFERAMVQDRDGGPAWMLLEPLIGIGTMSTRDENGTIAVPFEQIDNAVDVENGLVVFHLKQPYAPFIQILAQSSGSIVDENWYIAQGDWPGTAETYETFNNPQTPPLQEKMNGTGPFKLDRWEHAVQVVLLRNDTYWRTPAKLKSVVIREVDDWASRKLSLLAGDADFVYVHRTTLPEIENTPGVRITENLPQLTLDAIFFNFEINENSEWIGSRTLDGNGIPTNFFSDKDVRLGFAYSFDWDTFIQDAFLGHAKQPASPVIDGLPYVDPSAPKYYLDPVQAENHFRQAFGGALWDNGFKLTILYNTGNDTRLIVAEILKQNIESLNPKFSIVIENRDWATYLNEMVASKLPLYYLGWQADYPDPHNFVSAFMHSGGNISAFQHYSNPLVDNLISAGVVETDPAVRRAIYYQLQQIYHDDVPSLPTDQAIGAHVERDWVHGWYYNPIIPGTPWGGDYYPVWKG